MKLTIERLRTLVLAAGVLLLIAVVTFLAIGKWKHPFNRHDIPKRLGIDIQQEANGVTYTQARGGHTLFKLHASKVVQLKAGKATLHDVQIELYGSDGKSVDRIEGSEFDYDQKAGTARADGVVKITLMRPGASLAIAPKAAPTISAADKGKPLAEAAATAERGQVHVETSGLTFDQKSGSAQTSQKVTFTMVQGSGSAMGAFYDSEQGTMTLISSVQLHSQRNRLPVDLRASHAVFERNSLHCTLNDAALSQPGQTANATLARINFRDDGSIIDLDASNGFHLDTARGSQIKAPHGTMQFDERNQPHQARLEGGVNFSTSEPTRTVLGEAPSAELRFNRNGLLERAHLERGVHVSSHEQTQQHGQTVQIERQWQAPVTDLDFASGKGNQLELIRLHGAGGVQVASLEQMGKNTPQPSHLSANDLIANFGPHATLRQLIGDGQTHLDQVAANGNRQSTNGDHLEANLAPGKTNGITSAIIDGHVVLTQTPAAPSEAPLRATAEHAVYDSQWLHLTTNPHIVNGNLEFSADKIDVAQSAGDAFGHGNVKATWANANHQTAALGGNVPAHVVAAEAVLHQATGEVSFRQHARLWQGANSIAAPEIMLNRTAQNLVAHGTAADPMQLILLSADSSKQQAKSTPTVVRISGGELHYSDPMRQAVIQAGLLSSVEAQTSEAHTSSREVELQLLPAGNGNSAAQVDQLTARGHVVLVTGERRGTGDKLVYQGQTGDYILTGTEHQPPRITDPAQGSLTGATVTYHSHTGAIRVEGSPTTTETHTPR